MDLKNKFVTEKMAQYGERISYYDPIKENIYSELGEYFDDPVMFKIRNVGEVHTVYMCNTHMLMNKYHYIIAVTDFDPYPVGSSKNLKDLEWKSLQTRTLEEYHKLPKHAYIPKRLGISREKINKVYVDNYKSVYSCEKSPLQITLLHKRTDTKHEYQNTGYIGAALETYSTLISFKNN